MSGGGTEFDQSTIDAAVRALADGDEFTSCGGNESAQAAPEDPELAAWDRASGLGAGVGT